MAYQCEECGLSFAKLRQLLQHRKTQNHWKKYICSRCSKVFNRKSNLDRHMLRHQDENKFHCPQCSKVFISGNALANHLLKHGTQYGGVATSLGEEHGASNKTMRTEGLSEPERLIGKCHPCPEEMTDTRKLESRPYQCDLCGKSYPRFQTLKTHITDHLQIALKCLECCVVLKTKGNFLKHIQSHNHEGFTCNICGAHFTGYRPFQRHARFSQEHFCDLCGQICCYYSDLRAHVAAHLHGSVRHIESYLRCSFCSNSYAKDRDLQKHLLTHKRSFSCDICGSKWNNKQHLEKHFNTHCQKRNGTFNCSMCDKAYRERNRIVEHMQVVHFTMGQEKRHICQWCGKAFMRRSCLLMHEKSVHVSKGTLYQCDNCGKNFNTKRRLKIHLLTHSDIKKYSCNVCGRKFGHPSSLWRHMLIHSGEKKHSCSYCDFKCIQLYSLKRHILTHTGQKPHACDLCGEQFRQIFALTKHKRKHHLVS